MAAPTFTEQYTVSERSRRDASKPAPERKKRVVVTGGSGKLGKYVIKEMVEHGWQVINVDQIPPREEVPGTIYFKVNLADYGEVVATLTEVDSMYRGIDAIIHLAAIPAPGKAPNHVVFHNNILSTYNIVEAARVVRIKNIALASSETVFGLPLYPNDPPFLPITEEITSPETSYSLSKYLGEKLSEQYTRWDPEAKIINIRLSNVMDPSDYLKFPHFQNDPWSRSWNGFCYIDGRDCAQAFRLAIEKDIKGTHVFNIANADIAFTQTTAELAKLVFPNVKYTPETQDPREGLISIKKARKVLGFDPKYDWQSEVKRLQSEKQ